MLISIFQLLEVTFEGEFIIEEWRRLLSASWISIFLKTLKLIINCLKNLVLSPMFRKWISIKKIENILLSDVIEKINQTWFPNNLKFMNFNETILRGQIYLSWLDWKTLKKMTWVKVDRSRYYRHRKTGICRKSLILEKYFTYPCWYLISYVFIT